MENFLAGLGFFFLCIGFLAFLFFVLYILIEVIDNKKNSFYEKTIFSILLLILITLITLTIVVINKKPVQELTLSNVNMSGVSIDPNLAIRTRFGF